MRASILAVLLMTSVAGCRSSQERLSEAVSNLHKGMTRQEVAECLGYPTRISYKDNWTIWVYNYADGPGKVHDVMVGGNMAQANARVLALAFDPSGHLESWQSN